VRRRKDGTFVNVSVTISPIRDAAGRVVGGAKIAHDIGELTRTLVELRSTRESLLAARATLERKVEERTRELSAALEKAQEVDRLKSEFLATMSHELRTPLNSVIGFTELVIAGVPGPVNEEQKRQLGMAHLSARHLLHLINDLLDLARIESGRFEPAWERFSPAEAVQEAIDSLQPIAARKALQLVTDLSLPTELCSDRKMFFQILLNLLANAVKFTERGQVILTSRPEGDLLVTRVADTGIGIKPEQMQMLFEAFRQVDGTSRRRYEGTGLGLYLSRRLVTLLEFGVGSTFTFTVPLQNPRCA
jgi:signal transduction histidine kinase